MALEAINIEAGQAKTRSLRGTDRVYRLIELSLLKLSPRLRQPLAYLLEGDSEKQVADRLDLSHATIHEYVTALYRHFGVGSRAQLMADVLKRIVGRT